MGRAQYRTVGDTVVGSILFKGNLVEFAIDLADWDLVKQYRWHYVSNAYIATSVRVDCSATDCSGAAAAPPKKRELYLHTLLLKPGPAQTVVHISKNGLDNRRANLKLVEGSAAAAASSTKKKRNVELPPLCGVKPEEIPCHIWYVQANGYHRDRFAIEFKTEGILWKSTSSKEVSLREKLEQAKEKLQELYSLYPHLDPKAEAAAAESLQASFEAALSFQPPAQQ